MSMKPRILILMHYMELGGAESALLGLLLAHDPQMADIDLFVYSHRGELMPYIPETVNLLPEDPHYAMLEIPLKQVVAAGAWRLAFARLIGIIETRLFSRKNVAQLDDSAAFTYQQRRTVKTLSAINPVVEYDLAISFITPHYIVLDKVRAKKKIGWIHTDYTNVFVNRQMELEMWRQLDHIVSISAEVGKKFIYVFPELQGRLLSIENILSSAFMRKRSEEFQPTEFAHEDGRINLLSIGRYCNQKRFDEIGTLFRKTRECLAAKGDHRQVYWYIIGYGLEDEKKKIIQNVCKEGMQDFVILLGKKSNPYPYIQACDFYVQPSRYEGKSITVREAQILGKPVIVDNYPTAASQIMDGIDGVIVPFDLDGCAQGIANTICNRQLVIDIIKYLRSHDYGNESEIKKIYSLL